jgi:hypothetical protein
MIMCILLEMVGRWRAVWGLGQPLRWRRGAVDQEY